MIARKHSVLTTILTVSLCLVPYSLAQRKQDVKANQARLVQEVRHELVMLSDYSLFDNLEFQITGVDTVILSGQVVRPILKSEAENAIRKLERVGKVVNNIEVLPVSPQDDAPSHCRLQNHLQQTRTGQIRDTSSTAHSYHRQERQDHAGWSCGKPDGQRPGRNCRTRNLRHIRRHK